MSLKTDVLFLDTTRTPVTLSVLQPLFPTARIAIVPANISSKEDLLGTLAKELEFPSYFGRNWDALVDCLRDYYSYSTQTPGADQAVIAHTGFPENISGTYWGVLADCLTEQRRNLNSQAEVQAVAVQAVAGQGRKQVTHGNGLLITEPKFNLVCVFPNKYRAKVEDKLCENNFILP
ncbi:hypothetical protein BC938DRAFT_474966 [Jimgerdemannia flammicorona]|uniref:Barstar (barnase inhibitor) domain-containing protein n=1 Tax=Jimgerdemannia flammicorona TaxID=994334 RepID=A0A433Q170_9FUNG|nr:hypothetical protein BC938DRAFT_474966 [Jimgerdemannia flammicorona]